MSYVSERKSIELEFSTSWATATPVKWDNVDFEPTAHTSFVSFHIIPSKAVLKSIGAISSALYRSYGMIEIQIYTPINQGAAIGASYADRAIDIFRNKRIDDIRCDAGQIQNIEDVGEWFCTIVTIPFYRDEIT